MTVRIIEKKNNIGEHNLYKILPCGSWNFGKTKHRQILSPWPNCIKCHHSFSDDLMQIVINNI